MPWVRLDDGYPEHPKVDRVGALAAWLNVCAWAYCARNLTDGFVPTERVSRLASVSKPQQLVAKLLEVKLWESVDGGYMVHDYLVYNPSREQVLKDRAGTAQRAAEHRARRNTVSNVESNAVSHAVSHTVSNGESNAVSHTVSNGVSTDAPYPSRIHPVKSPKAATQQKPPLVTFTEDERVLINAVGAALLEFGFRLEPGLWRKVLDTYRGVDLEAEAYKQADWMRRNRIKNCTATRYTNWLDKALPKVTPTRHVIDRTGVPN